MRGNADPVKQQITRDKKAIDNAIVEAKRLIAAKQFAECESALRQIAPAVRRLGFRIYEFNLVSGMLHFTAKNLDQARSYLNQATLERPDDPLCWRKLIEVDNLLQSPKLKDTITQALQTAQIDLALLKVIAPFLKSLGDSPVLNSFVLQMDRIEGALDLPITNFIPEVPSTLNLRIKMLSRKAKTDADACSTLIHTFISESDPSKSLDFIEYLPQDHPDVYFVKALLGDNPVQYARLHAATGSPYFEKFLTAVDASDEKQLRFAVQSIIPFQSGWQYLIAKIKDPQQRNLIVQEAISRFPDHVPFYIWLFNTKEQLGDIQGALNVLEKISQMSPNDGLVTKVHFLLRIGRLEEANELIKQNPEVSLSESEKTKIGIDLFKKDQNPEHIRPILQREGMDDIKAEVAYLLRDELHEKAEQYFIQAMKTDRNNPIGYLYYGKYLKTGDKAVFLMKKAVELGSTDPEALEVSFQEYIKAGDLENALHVCFAGGFYKRSGLVLQRLNRHEEATYYFQEVLKSESDPVIWSALAQSYLLLGRAMAAKSIAEQLREVGTPDNELESQISTIFGFPIENSDKPVAVVSKVIQVIVQIRNLIKFGRKELCQKLVDENLKLIEGLLTKHSECSVIFKVASDLLVEAFRLNNDGNCLKKALEYSMRRTEIDKRAESFIDIARIFTLMDEVPKALAVLRKALPSFKDHAGIWLSLGILNAEAGRPAFARHCFSVSALLSTNSDISKEFALCAALDLQAGDMSSFKTSIKNARNYNPYSSLPWELELCAGSSNELDMAESAYEFGPTESIIKMNSWLSLANNRPNSLNYALMSGDEELVTDALEANMKYLQALDHSKNEQQTTRIRNILNSIDFENGEETQASKLLGCVASKLSEGNPSEASKLLVLDDSMMQDTKFIVDEVKMEITPRDQIVKSEFSQERSKSMFFELMRTRTELEAAHTTLNNFPADEFALTTFCQIVTRTHAKRFYKDAAEAARKLHRIAPSTNSLKLLTTALVHQEEWEEAQKAIKTLEFIDPSLIGRQGVIKAFVAGKISEGVGQKEGSG